MDTSTTIEEEWTDPDGLLELLYDYRYKEAESLLKRLISEEETAHLYHRLGYVLLAQNRHDGARKQHKRAAQICPSEPDYACAVAVVDSKLLPKSRQLKRLMELGRHDTVLCSIGDFLVNLGLYREAVSVYELTPTHWERFEIYCRLCGAYIGLEMWDKADEYVELAAKIHPNCSLVSYYDFMILLGQRKFQEAWDIANELEPEADSRPIAYKLAGISYLYQRKFPQAIEKFSAAIQLLPWMSDIYYYRAACHACLKEHDLGRNDINKALKSSMDEAYVLRLKYILELRAFAYPHAARTLIELLLYRFQHTVCRYNSKLLLKKARKQGFFDRSLEPVKEDVWPPAPKGG